MHAELGALFGDLSNVIRESGGARVTFSAEAFKGAPEIVKTDRLVVQNRLHTYANAFRVDQLNFFASKETFEALGLLILSVVFREGGGRANLDLTNPASEIKQIVIEYEGSTLRSSGHRSRPQRFDFYLGEISKHPWSRCNYDVHSLPSFRTTNEKDFLDSEEDWMNRDILVGFGNDDANVRLADLLLNLGSPRNEVLEVVLEGECGFRGVGLQSSEAVFVLPGSLAWNPLLPESL